MTLRCLSVPAASGKSYSARFPTQQGYQSIRLPFTVFRPMDPFDEGFDVKASPIVQMTVRQEASTGLPWAPDCMCCAVLHHWHVHAACSASTLSFLTCLLWLHGAQRCLCHCQVWVAWGPHRSCFGCQLP